MKAAIAYAFAEVNEPMYQLKQVKKAKINVPKNNGL
jgi:hypothetical protein